MSAALLDLRRHDSEPPNNLAAEHALLGICLYDNAAADECQDLHPTHFYEPFHGRVWVAIRDGRRDGKVVDHITLDTRLAGDPAYAELGGRNYLADLIDNAPPTSSCAHFAAAVIDAAMRRDLVSLARETQERAASGAVTAEDILAAVEAGCADIARESGAGSDAVPIGLTALANLRAAAAGEFRGVETGLVCIDRVTGGMKPDDVWFIGGRSSMGKSVLGVCIGRNVARQGFGVQMFSLEMGERETQARLTADIAHRFYEGVRNIRYTDILLGRLDPNDIARAESAAQALAELPFMFSEKGGLTIDEIRSQARRQVRAWDKSGVKPGVIIIDHIGLVKPVRKTDNKAADTADIVNELKDMAKQIGCPILALAQVNRGPEGRQDKRPTMADLNWSGSIEQIADLVMLLYRQSYYDARSSDPTEVNRAEENKFDLELSIQKNRSGPVCNVKSWIEIAANAVRDVPHEHNGREYG